VKKYQNEGWNILNKAKTGAIGGCEIKITQDFCKEEALKYKTKTDFYNGNASAYFAAKRNKWLNDICGHMTRPLVHNFKYNFNRCQIEALKYTTRSEFNKYSHSIYVTVCTNKWLIEICKHMKFLLIPSDFWTKEKCKEEALKYQTRGDLKKYSSGAYLISMKNKWLNEFFLK